MNQLLTVSPQRRPARLAAPINSGVTISLRSSVSISDTADWSPACDTCCSGAAEWATLRYRAGAAETASASGSAGQARVARDELCPTGVAAGRNRHPSESAAPADLSAGAVAAGDRRGIAGGERPVRRRRQPCL